MAIKKDTVPVDHINVGLYKYDLKECIPEEMRMPNAMGETSYDDLEIHMLKDLKPTIKRHCYVTKLLTLLLISILFRYQVVTLRQISKWK